MTRITRRRALALSGAGAAAASTGGLAGILASGRTPAFAQEQTLHWVRWSDFVPSSDVLLKGPITDQCKKETGITLRLETINANDIQARVTSSIQSGAGPDIIMALNNWPQLYATSLADVSDVAGELGEAGGGYYDLCKVVGTYGGKWIGVPWCVGGGLVAYRKSWLAEVGFDGKFPANWDEYRAAGKKLKANGHPYGQTAGHTFGDAPGWWYPYLWSWGGKEVEADGKTVVLNSKETIESVKFAVPLWKETMDEGGLAWDDTSNNRAFLSGSISATNNGASIYLEAKKKPDTYLTDKGTPMFQQWFDSQQGYTCGATKDWENDPVWNVDPVMRPFKDIPSGGRMYGYAGPPSQKAAEVQTKYIIVDMYAKAIQGMPAEESVKAAHDELVKIYGA
jgi:ABC-type glycerol-3-phosphate transport system substrate-binding protein